MNKKIGAANELYFLGNLSTSAHGSQSSSIMQAGSSNNFN
jgi:hypothetical protein